MARPPKQVVRVGADEAEELLHEQDRVVGYDSIELAEAIRKELTKRGMRTRVIADVGPVIRPRGPLEGHEILKLGLRPGERRTRFGLVRVRGHMRRLDR